MTQLETKSHLQCRHLGKATASVLIAVLPLLVGGCFSWAPVSAGDMEPRITTVSGTGDARWSEEVGWERPRRGGWGAPERVRAESLKAFEAGAYADALAGFQQTAEVLAPDEAARVESDFYIAECAYQLGNYPTAIEHYRLVCRRGGTGEAILNQTFERVYAIALDYITGRAGTSFLFKFMKYRGAGYGVDLLVSEEAGEEGLITEYPYLDFADDALMEIARYYFEAEDYDEAERFYRRVVAEYPNRNQHELAQYQLAVSVFAQIRGVDFEQEYMNRADKAYRRYLEEYPRGRHAEEARGKLRELTEMQGESYLEKAKFYLRESQVQAARIYLQIVLDRYTTTDAARQARDIVAQIDRVEAES